MKSKMIKGFDSLEGSDTLLICFPYAGGGASAYNNWRQIISKEITVCSVQLPGREERFSEKPYSDMQSAVYDLVEVITPFMDQYKNIAFFGHSMGANIAYEVAKKLQTSQKYLKYLFVSGSSSPNTSIKTRISHLKEDEFVKQLEKYGGTPRQLIKQKELLRVFLPLLRADFSLVEGYTETCLTKIECPIITFAGKEDKTTNISEIQQWSAYTDRGYESYVLSGEHFFIREHERKIVGIIEEKLLNIKMSEESMARETFNFK